MFLYNFLLSAAVQITLIGALFAAGSAPAPIWGDRDPVWGSGASAYTNHAHLEPVRRGITSADALNPYLAAFKRVEPELASLQRDVQRAATQRTILIDENILKDTVSYDSRATDWSLLSATIVFFANREYTEALQNLFFLTDESAIDSSKYITHLVKVRGMLDGLFGQLNTVNDIMRKFSQSSTYIEEREYQQVIKTINTALESLKIYLTEAKIFVLTRGLVIEKIFYI